MSFVTDQKAIEYLSSFPKTERQPISSIYKGCGEEGIDLLERILQFNPYFRISIDDCLAHPFFASIRKPEKELVATEQIKFDFEKESLDRDKLR